MRQVGLLRGILQRGQMGAELATPGHRSCQLGELRET